MLNIVNHDQCLCVSEMFVNQSPALKVAGKQVKQVWKATGKLFTTIGHQWRPTGRLLPLGDQWPITRNTPPKVLPTKQWKPTGRLIPLGRRCPLVRSTTLKSECMPADPQETISPVAYNLACTNQQTQSNLDPYMMRSSPICLLSKASKNKSWLWHRRLNHLNFGTLNDLARKDLVRGLPRLKFEKDHLCSACQLGKSRKATHKPKTINTITKVLHTLHMDLCGPLRVQSINGKKYILVIVDDYSRFTWVKFLRSKDETLAFVINLLKQLQVGLNKTVRFVRTDNGTEFVNKDLTDYYESVGITHEKTVLRTPQQNGVAEAVATACYTQNRSLIHTLHNKTPYELVHDKKPDLSFLRRVTESTTNGPDKSWKLFTSHSMSWQTALVHSSSGPAPNLLTPGPKSSGLVPNSAPAIPYVPLTNKDLELLFQPMFDEYFETPTGDHPMPPVPAAPTQAIPTDPSVSISFDHDAPSGSHSPSSSAHQSSLVHHGVATSNHASEQIHFSQH
ncbi:retrovirus-related pol polyprotein from transposon TNT 1-94 [Tanacetum coccineum]